jgi:predicted flavoprotein YhiN
LLDGAVHPKLAAWLLGPGGPGADGDPARLAGLLKRWEFTVEGPGDERQAQVVQGGLSNDAFDPLTLEARRAPGLFACGEALDVDGACGGFNLAWAWVSGLVAGRAAARAVAVRTRHAGCTTTC